MKNILCRLEDPDSEETKEFVDKQSTLTDSVLAVCDVRDKIRRQITALYDHPRYDTPFKRGNRYFYFHNTGLQAQSVLYVQVLGPFLILTFFFYKVCSLLKVGFLFGPVE